MTLLDEKVMSLPIRTTLEDVREICAYLAAKPTGATPADAKRVLDSKYLDGRKITAYKAWLLVEETESDGKLKITSRGRRLLKGPSDEQAVLREAIRSIAPYDAIIERAAHRKEDSLSATEVAAHWHEHFPAEVSEKDKILNDQAVCFFQIATGAGLGQMVAGRHGSPTRLSFVASELAAYIQGGQSAQDEIPPASLLQSEVATATEKRDEPPTQAALPVEAAVPTTSQGRSALGRGIFIAHGKNKKPLDQLKAILHQFQIPFKVAVDEPNLGRPIGSKIREIMEACNCAILIFSADEEFKDKNGATIWRPSENVVYELGASGYLYDNRIVIMKEDEVHFPSNFRDIGYISFEKDKLDSKAMEILKELIGFGIVKVST